MPRVKELTVAYKKANQPPPISKKLSSAKQSAMTLLKRLPNDVTYEDIMYELYVLDNIQKGLDDAGHGRVVSHADVKKRLKKWLV